jgi:uncharacterized protein YeaO (DUF488 family)
MAQCKNIRVRRIYDPPLSDDGTRILVDRLWARGMSKARAHLDEWCKDVAPSHELRTWYGHDPALFEEFASRYREELTEPSRAATLLHLRDLARERMLTLLTATRDVNISAAAVLAALVARGSDPGQPDPASCSEDPNLPSPPSAVPHSGQPNSLNP